MSIKIQSYAWDIPSFKGNTKLIILCLADFANDDGQCWPSVSTVARKSGVSVSTVKSIIKSLVEEGWLSRKSRSKIGTDGRRVADSNLYTLNVAKLKKVARENEPEYDQSKSGYSYDTPKHDQPNSDHSNYDQSKEVISNSQNTDFEQPESGYDPSIDPLIDPSSKDLAPSYELEPDEIPEFLIPTNRKGEFYEVYPSEIQDNESLYPAVDVRQEYRKMIGWANATPKKRKTHNGMPKFINSWLSREQDKGGSRTPPQEQCDIEPVGDAEMINREIYLIESNMNSINQQLSGLNQSNSEYHNAAKASLKNQLKKLGDEREAKLAKLKELAA